jgi:hypothetical protein
MTAKENLKENCLWWDSRGIEKVLDVWRFSMKSSNMKRRE